MTKKQIADHIIHEAAECFYTARNSQFIDMKKAMSERIFAYAEMYFSCFANNNPFDPTYESIFKLHKLIEGDISRMYSEIFK